MRTFPSNVITRPLSVIWSVFATMEALSLVMVTGSSLRMIPSAIALRHRYQELTLPVFIMGCRRDGDVQEV